MNTKIILIIFSSIILIKNSNAQNKSSESPHNGFQFSLFAGSAFGDIKGKTSDGLNPVFRGSGISMSFDLGYAINDFSVGLYGNINSVAIKSVEVNDTAYSIQPGFSMDNSISGIYLCKYFMPINAYIRVKGGIGKFTISDAEFNELGSTDRGFGWSLTVGKDFLIGKKKIWGIGGFISVIGIKCHDLPPWDNDTYSYFAPSLGIVIAYR